MPYPQTSLQSYWDALNSGLPNPNVADLMEFLRALLNAGAQYRADANLLPNGDVERWSAGAAAAPDDWTLSGAAATIARDAVNVKRGLFSAAVTRAGTDALLQRNALTDAGGQSYVRGRVYTLGAWVRATVASRARLRLNDGVGSTFSQYHTGGSGWEWLTVTRTADSLATALNAGLSLETGNTTAQLDGAVLVEGDVVPAYELSPWEWLPHGQCRLTKSGSNLLLSPRNGNKLIINGRVEAVPNADVTLAPTGLIPTTTFRSRTTNVATLTTASAHELITGEKVNVTSVGGTGYNGLVTVASTPTSTTFTYANTGSDEGSTADTAGRIECDRFIYAFMSSGVMTLEARGKSIAHSAQAGTGVEIATADATRSLVGMARIVAGPAWESDTKMFVRSWFNRRGQKLLKGFSVDRTTTSTTFVELNTEIRVEFLVWPDEAVFWAYAGNAFDSASTVVSTAIGFDGATAIAGSITAFTEPAGGGARFPISAAGGEVGLAEGYHFVTLLGRTGAGTATWTADEGMGLQIDFPWGA